jgi:hypothetical protein
MHARTAGWRGEPPTTLGTTAGKGLGMRVNRVECADRLRSRLCCGCCEVTGRRKGEAAVRAAPGTGGGDVSPSQQCEETTTVTAAAYR